ncbi:hypothetical protein JHK87_053308 [Glycine soja]|nr:hypothetical protein JHK87_053308 [Glycine soja]
MVWLIDFQGWSTTCLSLKTARDTTQILQAHYPEMLGLAIFYNPPKSMVKPFLEPKTYKKVIFVYPDNPRSHMVMEEHLDMDKLESYFGGKNTVGFNYQAYAQKMKEGDRSMSDVFDSCRSSLPGFLSSEFHESVQSETNDSEDEASRDGVVFSNLEEDDDSTHGKMPCSQYESSGVDESKKT